jgi:hypothetical protein
LRLRKCDRMRQAGVDAPSARHNSTGGTQPDAASSGGGSGQGQHRSTGQDELRKAQTCRVQTHGEEACSHIAASRNGDVMASGYRKLRAQVDGISDMRRAQMNRALESQ